MRKETQGQANERGVVSAEPIPDKPSAYVEAQKLFGLRTVQEIRRAGMRVVWMHTWRSLWSWHADATETFAEFVIDERVPEDLKVRAQQLIHREV
jgi:hypothetical protein